MPLHRLNVVAESAAQRSRHPLRAVSANVTLPNDWELSDTSRMPPVYDQGPEGSCTANAGVGADEFVRVQSGKPFLTPSRQFLYAMERIKNGDLAKDAGANISDICSVLTDNGICKEATWPYTATDEFVKPSDAAIAEAANYKLTGYAALECTPEAVMEAIAAGHPVVFGFDVPQSFEATGEGSVAQTGIMTHAAGEPIIGGHAVWIHGYHKEPGTGYTAHWWQQLMKFLGRSEGIEGAFRVRNSWGASWGLSGDFVMSFDIFRHLAFDPYALYTTQA